ncbi:hypothetical protein CDD83_8676 [Cordyceps sp. RAO-2017]|nr:hypothetical protein CDD83_8676 [Cordyceps sp. RAO-2017]
MMVAAAAPFVIQQAWRVTAAPWQRREKTYQNQPSRLQLVTLRFDDSLADESTKGLSSDKGLGSYTHGSERLATESALASCSPPSQQQT